jgi:rod shape-determining protein MreD
MSIVLGIIYDSYFIGVIGIAAALLPLIVMFVNEIQTTVFQNRWTKIFTTIIIVFAFEVIIVVIEIIFKIFDINFVTFVVKQLAPSLILNIIFISILQFPLEAFYRDRTRKDREVKREVR